jgi:integrase
MATGKITKRSVDELQSGTRDSFLWDGDLRGFGVKISKAGIRTYIYQYRMGGREASTRRYTIGQHGSPWTPASARSEAERLAITVAQGVDPNAAELERRRLAVDLAFEPYSQRFRQACGDKGWGKMVERSLRLHIVPYLKRKPINTITRANIAAMLDHIPVENVALRRNTFAVIRRLFRDAVSRGDIERSPCEGMETPRAVKPRDRVLSDAELARVWHAAGASGKLFGPIVRLLIATGQRREEVSGLDWSEVSLSERLWTLPAERSKNGVAHMVPLNACAMQVLQGIAKTDKWPECGLVFATSGKKRFIAHSKGKQKIDSVLASDGGSAMLPWRLHDIRRTLATGFQKLGVRFEVTESVLNHLSGSKAGVAATYQKHDWASEKRQAMDLWSHHIRSITGVPGGESAQALSPEQVAFDLGLELGLVLGKLLPR